jgi:4,5-dihydroxyphthalate decarboxylase
MTLAELSTNLRLSAAFTPNPLAEPVVSGAVVPEGIHLLTTTVHASEMFYRQLRYGDFDVSEMSMSSLIIAASKGQHDWLAVPVFTARRFFHTNIVVRADSDIASPKDLVGHRVGVSEYQQTAAVWSRGALQHEFGVHPSSLKWTMERQPDQSHGGNTGFVPPAGIEFEYAPPGKSLRELMADGYLDAALTYSQDKNLIDKPAPAKKEGRIRKLFPDPTAEAVRYHQATGILPVNHVLVVRRALFEEHPWITLNLYSAFLRAKAAVTESVAGLLQRWVQIGAVDASIPDEVSRVDATPYGFRNQADIFATLSSYLHEQGLTEQRVDVAEVFAPNTLDL